MKLWAKVLIAICLGIATGVILGEQAEVLKPIGTLFLNLLNMLIVPLIFATMTTGVTSSPNSKKLGRIGLTSLLLYTATTLIAIMMGIFLAASMGLGSDLHFSVPNVQIIEKVPVLSEILINIIPRNPIKAFAEGNILQIIVFSLFFGTALKLSGEKAKPVIGVIESLASVMLKFTSMVMYLSPFGVFALMAWATGAYGLEVLLPVGKFLLSYYAASVLFIAVVICGMLITFAKLNPIPFLKGVTEIMAAAASTCSSSATLPVTISCATEKLGISKSLGQFLLPLGCSLNMNGSALFQAMSAIFIANAYDIPLDMNHYIILTTTVILATIGTASIPGGGLLMLSIVFSSIGLPLEGLAILASVDRLRDMATTILNTTSDVACAIVVAKREGSDFDERAYYNNTENALKEVVVPTSQG